MWHQNDIKVKETFIWVDYFWVKVTLKWYAARKWRKRLPKENRVIVRDDGTLWNSIPRTLTLNFGFSLQTSPGIYGIFPGFFKRPPEMSWLNVTHLDFGTNLFFWALKFNLKISHREFFLLLFSFERSENLHLWTEAKLTQGWEDGSSLSA